MSSKPALLFGFLLAMGSALVLLAYVQPRTSHAQATAALVAAQASAGPAPSLYRLESSFTSDDGQRMKLADLRGKFQVLALIFTRCPTVCPTLVGDLRRLEERLPASVAASTHFTLVSIDPEHDTLEVLRAYRRQLRLDAHFTLLRGELDDVRELAAVLGFSFSAEGEAPLVHSKLVTLLGPEGQLLHQQAGMDDDPGRIIELIAGAR